MFQIIREPEFARRIVERRSALGMRQIDCAKHLRVSRQMWNNWELGYCRPKGRRLRQMAIMLQCDELWLTHGDNTDAEQRLVRAMKMMRDAVRETEHAFDAITKRNEGLRAKRHEADAKS